MGIELDSVALQARLPENKRVWIVALLEAWSSKQVCKQKELESLIGHLNHACKIAPQGQTFLCRMIDLLCAFRQDNRPIWLNQEFRLDLAWWQELFHSWDGLSFFLTPNWAPLPDVHVSSDAAGALGYGAIFNGHWFFGSWTESQHSLSIAYKELFPIVVAAHVWGSQWVARQIEFLNDNESVVAVLKSSTSKDRNLMVLLHYLTRLAVYHSFSFTASSVQGKDHPVADAISCFQFQRFRQLAPLADVEPTAVPPTLLAALPVV